MPPRLRNAPVGFASIGHSLDVPFGVDIPVMADLIKCVRERERERERLG